jgi:hypothetical protein
MNMLLLISTAFFFLGHANVDLQHTNERLKQSNRVLMKALKELAVGFQYDRVPYTYDQSIWNNGEDTWEDGSNTYYRQSGKCLDWCEETPAKFSKSEISNENGSREDCFSTCASMSDCHGFQYQDQHEAANGDLVLPKCWYFTDPEYEGEWNCIYTDQNSDYECWTTTAPFGDNYVLSKARAIKEARATSRSHA